MKKIIVGFTLVLANFLNAQTAERVYSIAKEQRPLEWYQEQEDLWLKLLKKDKKNATAWCNYYESIRAQWILNDRDELENKNFKPKMDSLVNACYKTIPQTFEANYLMYRNFSTHANDENYFKYVKKAYEIDPLDPRTYEIFITHYALTGEKVLWHQFEEKYFNTNQISGAVYNWGYNLLAELDENAIVFVCGDNDTYSLWGLQSVKKFRPDVKVINTSLILVDDYRNRVLGEMGIDASHVSFENIQSQEDYNKMLTQLFQAIFSNTENYPVYVSGSAIFQFESDFGDKLYLTGLSYRYAEEEIDNISLIRRNYEKRYLLDYLTMTFAFNIQDNMVDHLNATYLPAFVKLYKHYSLLEDEEAKAKLLVYLKVVSEKSGQYETIMELIQG